MPQLKKTDLGLTFKFDCDRFLRFRLASDAEKKQHNLNPGSQLYRPGIELIRQSGVRYETERYQEILDLVGQQRISYKFEGKIDPILKRPRFATVDNLFEILRRDTPPLTIIEAQFNVPISVSPNLEAAYEKYGLQPIDARPDLMWIRKFPTGAPLIGNPPSTIEYEIHIVDIKMAAEPSLRHLAEVTYYGVALAAAIRENGLANRYAVSAEGYIWPGTHDINAFRNLYNDKTAKGEADPLTASLLATLKPVPYEVYQAHVKQFLDDRMPKVLSQGVLDTAWHLGPKCQFCDYLKHCKKEARNTDHLSRVAWLTQGQADLLRINGIHTTQELAEAIISESAGWRKAMLTSHQLRSERKAIFARAQSLQTGQPVPVEGRVCATMPRRADLNIFLTVHFDMATGITFAMGARREFFRPGRKKSDPPEVKDLTFITDRVDAMNTDTERKRLLEFIDVVSGWLEDLSSYNASKPKNERLSAHIYFWDSLELRQLGRMFQRHIADAAVVERIELLARLFPPESYLPDPELFKSHPGTIVKDVIRTLVGLPIPHDYTLFEVANTFHPFIKDDGTNFTYVARKGFKTYFTDQIPFERAYELWQDRVFLPHPTENRNYTRDEIYKGLQGIVELRLKALNDIVYRLKTIYGDKLILRKSPFSAAEPVQTKVPARSRQLIAFSQLNAIAEELKNRQERGLPVDEREARFISIRGLEIAPKDIDDLARARATQIGRTAIGDPLIAMTFSKDSRDCRIKEGEFLLALSNEEVPIDLDLTWYKCLDLTIDQAKEVLANFDLGTNSDRYIKTPAKIFLQVELAVFDPIHEPPYLALKPKDIQLFSFAEGVGLIDLNKPMVLDPIHRDFQSKRIKEALVLIGGDYPPIKRRKRPTREVKTEGDNEPTA